MKRYDVIVIGGGHAGAEAAWAAARLGARTAMVTMEAEAIGRMSCNPAIGGLGKGHMVREIDALGGLMGLATDAAGIQFRMLNRRKGPAVWAPRAQCDRQGYPKALQELLARAGSLEIVEGLIETIETVERPGEMVPRRVTGVVLRDGRRLGADAVIVTTGTFLRGLMHCGEAQSEGGRVGEQSAAGLSGSLKEMGFTLGRLKTGTPPRVHRDTIDYDRCEVQPGDEVPIPFSEMTDVLPQRQMPCWVTWTNGWVHEHITANLHRAPMYSGQIRSTGPRYCPSIEDKVVRFSDKPKHQIFLEPEGYDNERVYCNGISTSLPRDVQDAMVREVAGLEQARILQYGYAVEYDFVPTHQTESSLETKRVEGLFLAGQINGTSGYEEAAGQGLIAGINAVRKLRGEEAFVPRRDQAYLGVMVDDLITRPPSEPYRMFTSRAEYRLLLRSDNADQRLTPVGRALGLVDDARWERFTAKCQSMASIRACCRGGRYNGSGVEGRIRRPDVDLQEFAGILHHVTDETFCCDALWQVLVEAKYAGYVDRQTKQIERFRRLESLRIPAGIDYQAMGGLRHEARERLSQVRPATLGQAGRLTGISPADVTTLWIHLTGRRRARAAG